MRKTRTLARVRLAAVALLASVLSIGSLSAVPEGERALKLHHLHTGEEATIVFKRNGVYDKDGLQKLNWILRDFRIERPTNMDPHLFDLLWEVYQESGATEPIQILCGYRSPSTNALLRRRSSGVAEHSQHMLGKATDFFIPGVPLEKLREIGLRMQVGGVGYYPTSGSPFVHMDTGGVRMWPRMTREQLVRVFPQGKTLYIPSDGRPLPGYDMALAAYKARLWGATPVTLAENGGGTHSRAAAADATKVIVLTPQTASIEVPLPRRRALLRLEQRADAGAVVAMAQPVPPLKPVTPVERSRLNSIFDTAFAGAAGAAPANRLAAGRQLPAPREVDFDATYGAAVPPVPAVLARAMAARDQGDRSAPNARASLPIAPTAVVATVNVTRPTQAAAMTYAAFSGRGDKPVEPPPSDGLAVLAYASPEAGFVPEEKPRGLSGADFGERAVAIPAHALATQAEAAVLTGTNNGLGIASRLYAKLLHADLTMTALDTESLRLWMAAPSTREKRYALLTLPDFGQQRSLIDKPVVALASSFGHTANEGLRTDSFSGQVIQPLAVVDLTHALAVATQ